MGINLRLSSSANGTRNIGPVNMGGGSNLVERSLFASNTPTLPYSQWYVPGNGSPAISTSDYYLTNGLYWARPYDLDTMGSEGATVKAREGYRYVWLLCADHVGDFTGSADVFVAYSNDPQVFPDPGTMRSLIPYNTSGTSIVDQNGTTQTTFTVYQTPFLVYNPDDATYPFYIYMEGLCTSPGLQHQLSLVRSADLLTSVVRGPTIPTTTNSGWSSFGQPRRLGVNDWEVYCFGKPDGSVGTLNTYRYTSTDGWAWSSTFAQTYPGYGPYLTISGQDCILTGERPGGSEYVSYWPVDGNKQIIGSATRISTAFEDEDTAYPWQTLLQDIQAYEEDGVASIYVTRGFPADAHDRTNKGPYLGNSPHIYQVTADVSGTTFNVTAWPSGNPPLAVGFRIGRSDKSYISALGTGTGGVGTYTLNTNLGTIASQTFNIYTNGGLWHQMMDQYFLITDSTAAASAAPLGVKASCTNGTVTIQWNNCLPHSNYRVYRGTTVGTQATLIGDVTGTSITDTPTPGSQYFYKVVTMNGGEQGSRIVNVYASNNSLLYNKHYNRVINDGGDTSKIDSTFLATACDWLTNNDCWRYVNWWIDVRFGVKLDGSGFISKIYCLGTTWLPRGGDYTPTTSNTWPSTSSNTSYSSTSFRGTTPSWVNNANSAHGYFGNGRANNIQRWNEITLLAAYQKPGTASAAFFGIGEFDGMALQHSSGSPGTVSFAMSGRIGGSNPYTTASVAASSATAATVAAGTLDSNGDMKAWVNGTPGTTQSTAFANPNMTTGSVLQGSFITGSVDGPITNPGSGSGVLCAGSSIGSIKTSPPYSMNNQALYTGAGQAIFNKALSQALIQSWGALYA
jgi:hypothetical protein